jgi:hypothetical protein
MASEVEIRKAIRARIETFTASLVPPPLVLDRDITAALESGAANDLRDTADQIHCITVTPNGAIPNNPRNNDGAYDLWFDVIQYTEYRSGEDTTNPAIPLNSDDKASIEREKVIEAFNDSNLLDGVLKYAEPIVFPRGSIGPFKPGTISKIRVARGQLRVLNAYRCS